MQIFQFVFKNAKPKLRGLVEETFILIGQQKQHGDLWKFLN